MSLRTGRQVATTIAPIINPNNLKLEGLYCQDSLDKKQQLILLYQDIRDIVPQGIAINDHEVLSKPAELIRLKDILSLHFTLIDKPVITVSKKRLGKVNDFATEATTFFIQKIYITQSIFKSFSGGNMGIDRSQIVEITSRKIVVQDLAALQQVPATAAAAIQ